MSIDFDLYSSWRIDGKDHRFDRRYEDGTLILVEIATSRLLPMSEASLEELYETARATPLNGSRKSVPPLAILDERLVAARKRLWWARRYDKDPCPLSRRALSTFIRKHGQAADDAGHASISPTMLYRVVRQRGASKSRNLGDMIDGRSLATHPSPFDETVENAIEVATDAFYDRHGATKGDAYVAMRETLRQVGYDGRIPCRQTLSERIGAAATFSNVRRKFGATVAQARFRGVGKGLEADRPLECVVIDATPLDVLVVDDRTEAILGIPTVYVAIDVATRCVLAWHVAFGGETLGAVLRLVLEILTPKTGIRERFGLVHDNDAWGLPEQIIVDNALSQIGRSFMDSMTNIGIDAEFAPIGTPESKSVVERLHDTIKSKGVHAIAGARPLPRPEMEKLGLDPKVQAMATLDDIRMLLAAIVVDDYQRAIHSGLGMAPARAWAKGIAKHKRRIADDLRRVAEELGTYGSALLTREGVRIRNHRFHDQATTSGLLLDLVPKRRGGPGRKGRTSSGTATVKIKYDIEDASRILVWNGVRGEYVILPNTKPRWVEGLSFESCDVVRRYALAQNEAFESEADRLRSRARVIGLIERLSPGLTGKRLAKARSLTTPSDAIAGRALELAAAEIDGSDSISIGVAATTRIDGALTEPGRRRGGAAATRKAMATREARRRGETTPDQRLDAILASARPTTFPSLEITAASVRTAKPNTATWSQSDASEVGAEPRRRSFSEILED